MTATLAQPMFEQARSGAPPGDGTAANRAAVVAWMRLARVYTKIDRRTADHLKVYDLSVAQFDVLAQVGAHEGITQQELANVLLVTKGNVTQLLDRMTVRGLVERRPARVGRGNHLYLTPAGWDLNRRAVPAQEALVAACWTALDPEEIRAIDRTLRTLDRSLDSLAPFVVLDIPSESSDSRVTQKEDPSRG